MKWRALPRAWIYNRNVIPLNWYQLEECGLIDTEATVNRGRATITPDPVRSQEQINYFQNIRSHKIPHISGMLLWQTPQTQVIMDK